MVPAPHGALPLPRPHRGRRRLPPRRLGPRRLSRRLRLRAGPRRAGRLRGEPRPAQRSEPRLPWRPRLPRGRGPGRAGQRQARGDAGAQARRRRRALAGRARRRRDSPARDACGCRSGGRACRRGGHRRCARLRPPARAPRGARGRGHRRDRRAGGRGIGRRRRGVLHPGGAACRARAARARDRRSPGRRRAAGGEGARKSARRGRDPRWRAFPRRAGLLRDAGAECCILEALHVAPGLRGRGIGARLVAAARREAKARGRRRVEAAIPDGVRSPAVLAFCATNGFAPAGQRMRIELA